MDETDIRNEIDTDVARHVKYMRMLNDGSREVHPDEPRHEDDEPFVEPFESKVEIDGVDWPTFVEGDNDEVYWSAQLKFFDGTTATYWVT